MTYVNEDRYINFHLAKIIIRERDDGRLQNYKT